MSKEWGGAGRQDQSRGRNVKPVNNCIAETGVARGGDGAALARNLAHLPEIR